MAEQLSSVRLSILVSVRHFRIFKRNFLSNISPTLVDPFLYVLVFGAWLGTKVQPFHGRTYLEFMAPGIVAMTALFTSFFEGSYGFYVRLQFENVFKALMTTPVGPREILQGELIWLGTKAAIMAFFVSIVLALLGVCSVKFLWMVPILGAMIGVSCGSIGLLACTFISNINQFQSIYAWVISPMFFVSGMFVPISAMPEIFQQLIWISPFFHAVQLAQSTLWATNIFSAWLIHGSVLLGMSCGLAYWMWRRIFPKLYS